MFKRYVKPAALFLFEVALIWIFFYGLINVAALDDDPTFITFLLVFVGLTITLMKKRLTIMLNKKVSQRKIMTAFHHALKLGFMVSLPLGLLFGLMSVLLNLITLTDSVIIVSMVFTIIYAFSMYKIVPKRLKANY